MSLGTMKSLLIAFLVLVLLTPCLVAKDKAKTKKEETKKLKFDLNYKYDPRELHEYSNELKRWKRIKGMFYLGTYHIPPSNLSGPMLGPPRYIWTNGFGTSLWRDPVTGWPIM